LIQTVVTFSDGEDHSDRFDSREMANVFNFVIAIPRMETTRETPEDTVRDTIDSSVDPVADRDNHVPPEDDSSSNPTDALCGYFVSTSDVITIAAASTDQSSTPITSPELIHIETDPHDIPVIPDDETPSAQTQPDPPITEIVTKPTNSDLQSPPHCDLPVETPLTRKSRIPRPSECRPRWEVLETPCGGERSEQLFQAGGKIGTTKSKKSGIPRPSTVPQTPAPSGKAFKKLFKQSTCKKKMALPEADEGSTDSGQSSINSRSIQLAVRHEITKIKTVFSDREFCSRSELEEMLRDLAILDSSCCKQETELLNRHIDECRIDDDRFDAVKMQTKLLNAVTGKSQHKFGLLVSCKLLIVRANGKATLPVIETTAKMCRVTFDQLVEPKPIVPQTKTAEEVSQVGLSDAPERILRASQRIKDIEKLPLEERDRVLREMKNDAIQKLELARVEEERREMQPPTNLGEMPEFYGRLPDHVKQRAPKEVPEVEETFRPKLTPYSEYRKKQERLSAKEVVPVGWEESVQRIRLARLDRNQIQEALNLRSGPVKISQQSRYAEWRRSQIEQEREKKVKEESIDQDAVDAALGI
jgi:hypothetical protein